MLTAEGLTLWRGATCLFESLAFACPAGGALLVLGPNGSGKTTLLRIIAGLTEPEAGELRWKQRPLGDARREGPAVLAWCGHPTALKGDLTVRENLHFFARLSGAPDTEVTERLAQVGLSGVADLESRYLSAGQKRRAALARLLLSAAPLWLLDEPHTNLDVEGRALVDALVREHLEGGGSAVIAAHLPLALGACPSRELRLGTA